MAQPPSFDAATIARRRFLQLTGGAALFAALPLPAIAGIPADVAFRIVRDGDAIGEHRVSFRPLDGGGFEAVTEIEVAVKLAMLTLYSFRQRAVEHWDGTHMVGAEVRIEDQGEERHMVAERVGDVLQVEGDQGETRVPLGAMTDICFWNPRITRQRDVLDTWLAELVPLEAREGALETIEIGGRTVEARRYALRANRGRSGFVWYTSDGRWVRGQLRTRGEALDYLPMPQSV